MLYDLTIDNFLDKTSSSSPTPGGGSVCALVGALGAALSSMVGELTVDKDMDGDTKIKIKGSIKICKDLMKSLKEGMDKDTEAFNRVMTSYKMPKTNDEEKQIRSAAIQEALKKAAEEPYEVALLCLDVMKVAIDMLKIGNKNAASDAAVSGFLAYAALNGAIYNVKINLNSIKDEGFVRIMSSSVRSLIDEGEGLLTEIKEISAKVIG